MTNIVATNVRRNAIARLNRAVKRNLPLAGERFDWTDPTTGKGIGTEPAGYNARYGNARNGLRVLLWEAQEGLCAACGHGVAVSDLEVAHIVGNAGSPSKSRGNTDANIYASHATCNLDDADLFGDVVPPASLARPDLVMMTYPSRADMLAADASFAGRMSQFEATHRADRLAARIERVRQYEAEGE